MSKKTSAASKKTKGGTAGSAAGVARTTGFRVVKETSPSGMGCYYGQDLDDDYIEACTTTRVVGIFDTLEEARAAAKRTRDCTDQFDDWADEYYEDKPPPYFSGDGENPDEDEFVSIFIVDIGREFKEKELALQKARAAAPPKKRAKTATKSSASAVQTKASRVFGPAKGNFKLEDTKIFLRNPCRVAGGESNLPGSYGNGGSGRNSFAYLVQRISDRNYAMRSFCLDSAGARYTSFKLRNVVTRSVHWIAPTNLNDHGTDATILDACHLDLIDPNNGKCLLTRDNLLAAATAETKCMFLNGYQDCYRTGKKVDPNDIADAVSACPGLQCFSLNECAISNEILEALSSCSDLRGIFLSTLQNKPREAKKKGGKSGQATSSVATDAGLARVIRSCPKLTWIYVDSNIFGTACWTALADAKNGGTCPDLEVLWVDSTTRTEGRVGAARGDHSMIRVALNQPRRASTLKICMINPDSNLKSRYVIGGDRKTDRLEGDKFKTPKFDDYMFMM